MKKIIFGFVLTFITFTIGTLDAFARGGEIGQVSLMGFYSKTNYGNNAYSRTIRYIGSVGIRIFPTTELELAYTDSSTFMNNDPIQTTSVKEQILSTSINQMLVPPSWMVQPYIKVGAAQYNRRQRGTVSGIPEREVYTKSPSGVLGFGVRVFFLQRFSLNAEGVAYLPDLKIAEAHNNFSAQGGLGWHF